jgi:hypothetical protein
MACPYSTLLGEPGKGVHATRFLGLALNDTLMTIGAALLTSYLFNIVWWKSMIAWFIAGEILHVLFCVDSAFLRFIGVSTRDGYHTKDS